jgi:radical SAM superfamily enzyme YgiQ (UPF0313 family)
MLESLALVFPRLKYRSGDPPLGICYLAGHIRNIYPELKIDIIDTTFKNSYKSIWLQIKKIKPQALGVYIDSVMFPRVKWLLKELRPYVPIIIAGGPHSTVRPESLLKFTDIVVKGEGEIILQQLVQLLPNNKDLESIPGICIKKNGKLIHTPGEPPRPELDKLPLPALNMLNNIESYIETWHYLDPVSPKRRGLNVMASRGCSFQCSYCQPTLNHLFGHRVRYKHPEYLIHEIEYYCKKYKVNNFFFHDDTLTHNRKWIKEFCNLILQKNLDIYWGCNSRIDTVDEEILTAMYKAGLRVIHYGIESASQRIIDRIYNKKIKLKTVSNIIQLTKRIGIHPSGFFMLGAPTELVTEMVKTINFALGLGLDEASFSITTPFYGTYLYENIKLDPDYKIIDSKVDYYSQVSLKRKGIPSFLITGLQKIAAVSFYISPRRWKYIAKHLASFRGIRKLYNKIARFL